MASRGVLVTCEALTAVIAARIGLWLLPFRWLVRDRYKTSAPDRRDVILTPVTQSRVRWVLRGLDRAVRLLPGQSTCLARALAMGWMLRRRGIPSILYLGVDVNDGRLSAHAWLWAADGVVTGMAEAISFTPVAMYPSNTNQH